MTNIPIRFGQGQGLEASANQQTQQGLTELRNVALDLRDVIEKRDGSEQIALTTGSAADDVLDPVGLQAIAFRGEELVVWSDQQLYSRSRCSAADQSDNPVGVATDTQVSDARQNAVTALRTRRTFSLAGYVDAGDVAATETNRPTSATVTASGTTATVRRTANGAITATLSGSSGGFAVNTTPIELDAAGGLGGLDVRVIYIGDHVFPGASGFGPYFAAAWRDGTDPVRLVILQPDTAGSGVTYEVLEPAVDTFAVANRPYDLVYQDTITDGLLGTIVYCASATTVTARSFEATTGNTILNRTITLATGVAVQATDVIRAVPEALGLGLQTAALFLRQPARNEYRPLRFDAAFTQTAIRTPAAASGVAPRVVLSADASRQVAGTNDSETGGLHVFTATITTAPLWVATRGATSTADLTGAHSVEVEQTATEWQLRRDGVDVLTVAQDGGGARAVLQRGAVIVALIADVPVLKRMSWTPEDDGPTPLYAVVGSTAGHLAAAESANRVAYVYNGVTGGQVAVTSSSDGLAFTTSGLETLPAGETVTTLPGALLIDAETGLDDVDATWFYVGNFSGTAKVARRSVETADAVQGTVLATACQSSISSVYAEEFVGLVLVVLNVDPELGQSAVTYEFGADYVVQVDPRLVTLPGGNFGTRGPWTAARLRQELPIQGIGGGTVIASDVAEVQGCRAMIWQVSGGSAPGVYVAIVSDHLELPGGYTRVDATGTRPQAAVNHADGSALLTFLSAGGVIQWARWTPSSSTITFASSGLTPSNTQYRTLGVSTAIGSPNHKYVLVMGGVSPLHRVVRINATTLAILFNETYVLGGALSAAALAFDIESIDEASFIIRTAYPGPAGISTARVDLPDGGAGTLLTSNANSYTILPASVVRLAIGCPDDTSNYHLLVERSDTTSTELASNATTEPATLRRRWFQHTVWSGCKRVALNRTYAVIGGRGAFNRNASYFTLDLDTLEVVGRAFAEEGENSATQGTRLVVGHLSQPSLDLVADASRLLYAGAVQLRGSDQTLTDTAPVGIADLVGVGLATLTFDAEPFIPAELDGVLVHAHAGYPRMYAGDLPHEHDFHSWPVPVSVTTPAGGSLSAGVYNVILLFEASDGQGNVYRSFGGFIGPFTAAANDQVQVVTQYLAMTERRNVSVVMFRTQANGSIYYRDAVSVNDPDSSVALTISGTQSDAALGAREILDLALVPRNPCPATDLVAAVGGRFMARDPERGSLVRFTTPRSEGFAPWWSAAQGLETPSQRDVTAVGDLDGRVVIFTGFDIAVAQGSGPSATGAGSLFQGPDKLPSEIGALAQVTLAEIPQGLVYGSEAGPRILNRGLETQELAEQVYRYFEFDGYTVGRALYLPAQATLLIAARRSVDDELVLRLHVGNGRWAEDTERPILGMASSRSSVVAYLGRDGRLLIEGDAPLVRYQNLLALRSLLGRYPQYMFPGTLVDLVAGAVLALEGGAFLSLDLDTLGVFNRQSYDCTGLDGQSVVAEDTTVADLGSAQSLAIVWSQTLDVAPPALRGILGKQTTIGAEAFTGFRVTGEAAGIRMILDPDSVSDVPTQVDLTAASHTVGERRWFCAVIDFEAGVIRLGSDVEAEVIAAIQEPESGYGTSAPFRVLDIRDNVNPPLDGRVHWVALYRGTDLATFLPDCNAVAQALAAADTDAEGVAALAALADRTDGERSYVTSVATPWLREPTRDGIVHPGFTFQGASIFGRYLGSHALRIQVFYDFAETAEIDITIPRSQIDDEALAGRPYIYRIEQQDRRCYAVLVRFADTGEPNPTFRAEGIDIQYKSDGAKLAELPEANIARRTT